VSQKGVKQEEAEFLAAMTLGSLGKALSPEMDAVVEKSQDGTEYG